jgi:hypothetical protein
MVVSGCSYLRDGMLWTSVKKENVAIGNNSSQELLE